MKERKNKNCHLKSFSLQIMLFSLICAKTKSKLFSIGHGRVEIERMTLSHNLNRSLSSSPFLNSKDEIKRTILEKTNDFRLRLHSLTHHPIRAGYGNLCGLLEFKMYSSSICKYAGSHVQIVYEINGFQSKNNLESLNCVNRGHFYYCSWEDETSSSIRSISNYLRHNIVSNKKYLVPFNLGKISPIPGVPSSGNHCKFIDISYFISMLYSSFF